MARSACCLALAALVAAACISSAAASTFAVEQPTTYTQLEPVSKQWAIDVQARQGGAAAPMQLNCTDMNGCKPVLNADAKDKLTVTAALKQAPLKTIDNLEPKNIVVRACYTKPSTTDRPWRKSNNVIDKDRSCPFIIRKAPLNATSFSFDWPIPKNMTKATWYAAVLVQCQNGSHVSYCQFDTTKNQTYWSTSIINSTPPGMIIATAVCSAIGPLFLGGFFVKDLLTRKRQ